MSEAHRDTHGRRTPDADGLHPDALAQGRVRGRGAGINPQNRFESIRLHVLGEALDEAHREHPGGRQVGTRIVADATRSVLNRVDSPDLGLHWTLNPYRGCEHGCIYCYARPTHETLGYSSGLDFETIIVAKHEAPALLRRELGRPSWRGEPISMSGVTDPYQPAEERLRITRGCLEVMAECRQPVGVVTKSALVLRDADLLRELAHFQAANVFVSVTTLDNRLASRLEPRAASPARRLETIERLAQAGIPVGVMVAPIIPGLTDSETARILEAAAGAGARSAGFVLLRLPHQVKDLFLEWLSREFPQRAGRVESLIRQTRGGGLYDPAFGARQRGEGPVAEHIAHVFRIFTRRFGLNRQPMRLSGDHFRPPRMSERGQLRMF